MPHEKTLGHPFPETPDELAHIHPELLPPAGTTSLIFDMDGTLVDTLSYYRRCWEKVLQPLGFDPTEEWFSRAAALGQEEFLLAAMPNLSYEERHFHGAACIDLIIANIHEVEPMERTVEVVHAFRGRIPMAIVSNGKRSSVEGALRATDLFDCFDVILSADDVTASKPAPDGYLKALAMMGTDPQSCALYEDSSTAMETGRTLGMHVIDVRPHTTGMKMVH